MRVLVLHLVLWFPCVIWSSVRVLSYLNNGNRTLLESFDLFVHDFDWIFDEVQFRVNLNLIKWNGKRIVEKEIFKIRHMVDIMHVIQLWGNLS